MATTTELQTRCSTRFKDTGNAVVSAAEWLSYLNDAYDTGNGQQPWPWMQQQTLALVVPASTRSVTLPLSPSVRAFRVASVWNNTNTVQMRQIDTHWGHLDEHGDGTDTGTPEAYQVRNGRIEIFPLSAAATTLWVNYWGSPAALTASINPEWPSQYHNALVDGALSLAYQDDGNLPWADKHLVRAQVTIDHMGNELLAGTSAHYPQLTDDWWAD